MSSTEWFEFARTTTPISRCGSKPMKVRKPAVPPLCQTIVVSPTDRTIQFSPIDICAASSSDTPGWAAWAARIDCSSAEVGSPMLGALEEQTALGSEKTQHVDHVRPQCPGAGERRDVPQKYGLSSSVVTLRDPRAHVVVELDARLVHSERVEDPLPNQRLVRGHTRCPHQSVAQQSDAQIRILECRADVALELVARQEIIQLFNGIVGVWIGDVGWIEVRRKPR